MTRVTAPQRVFGAVAVAVALLALAACGTAEGEGVPSAGSEDNPGRPVETEGTAPVDEDAQALVFAGCMRDNGVDMPDPGPGQQGLIDAFHVVSGDDPAALDQAIAACEDLMPQYAQDMHGDDDLMLELAECLREQGLDVSDDPFADAQLDDIDPDLLNAAMEECRDVLTEGGR